MSLLNVSVEFVAAFLACAGALWIIANGYW